jgi:alkanesulfonate monooxygenase SsuD/methylene tetrahydromethanopterin reductase-like flavin-dependent oxidoreductase (luciferase family)
MDTCWPPVPFDPKEPGVTRVESEAPNGDEIEIRTTVHFVAVASEAEARDKAAKVAAVALNRLTFHRGLVIERAWIATGIGLVVVGMTHQGFQVSLGGEHGAGQRSPSSTAGVVATSPSGQRGRRRRRHPGERCNGRRGRPAGGELVKVPCQLSG